MPQDLQSILSDPSLFNTSSDITTKEILKRYGDLGQNGGPRHEVETTEASPTSRSRDGTSRPLAPVVTRVDTDPSQAFAWQKESSVRHVQEPSAPYAGSYGNQNTSPQQQWQDHVDHASPYDHRNDASDVQHDNPRRDYRNSGWGRPQNGSVGVTGAG